MRSETRVYTLAPLFSLFVNSLVYKQKEAEVGVKCGSQVIPVVLYADDAVILAEDEIMHMICGNNNSPCQGMLVQTKQVE